MTRMTTQTFTTAFAGALILGATLAVPMTAAASPRDAGTVSVSIDAAMLQSEAGIEAVYTLLAERAETACAEPGSARLIDRQREAQCRTKLLADFVESAGHDGLSLHHVVTTR